MKITSVEFKSHVIQLIGYLNDPHYVSRVINRHPTQFSHVCWSKNLGYSFLPFGYELVGFSGSKFTNKKPTNLSYLYEYHLIDDTILKVLGNDKLGNPHSTAYIFKKENIAFELELYADGEPVSLTKIIYENNLPISALKVDNDDSYWYYEYIYLNGKIKEICYNAYNSIEGILYIEYIDTTVKEIYAIEHGKKQNYYKM